MGQCWCRCRSTLWYCIQHYSILHPRTVSECCLGRRKIVLIEDIVGVYREGGTQIEGTVDLDGFDPNRLIFIDMDNDFICSCFGGDFGVKNPLLR